MANVTCQRGSNTCQRVEEELGEVGRLRRRIFDGFQVNLLLLRLRFRVCHGPTRLASRSLPGNHGIEIGAVGVSPVFGV